MTSSTLFGIYDDVGSSSHSMAETPWGTGAETPAHLGMGLIACDGSMGSPDAGLSMKSQARRGTLNGKAEDKRKSQSPRRARHGVWKYAVMLGKLAALFLFGVVYGLIVSHLHDTRQLAAVHVQGVGRESWVYLASWGIAGVALGSLLPYVDLVWSASPRTEQHMPEKEMDENVESPISEQINDVVRSVAAFIGIAFAIVSIPPYSLKLVRAFANTTAAPPPLAIHPPTHSHTRPRKPSALVHTRPLQARAIVLPPRHLHRHTLHLPLQRRRLAITIFGISTK